MQVATLASSSIGNSGLLQSISQVALQKGIQVVGSAFVDELGKLGSIPARGRTFALS